VVHYILPVLNGNERNMRQRHLTAGATELRAPISTF